MATDILPHKALNDISSMHYYLKQRVMESKHITDLIPFINQLIDIKDLKGQIITSLDKQYEKENSKQSQLVSIKSKSNLRSLFLSIFALNGIPSDIIHANIISFLPSKEYKKLPILSKHFRNVMINNPFIFNERGYDIQLQFHNRKFSKDQQSLISINHERNTVLIENPSKSYLRYMAEEKKTDFEQPSHEILQFHKVKCWKINMHYTFQMPGHQTQPETMSIFEDKHNAFLFDTIFEHNQTIERLSITLKNADIISRVLQQKESFNQLYALHLDHIEFNTSLNLDVNSFTKLEYLEFGINGSTNLDHVNNILEFTSRTLRAVKFTFKAPGQRYDYSANGWNSFQIGSDKCIKLPSHNKLEWICMTKCCLTLDMTSCENLIGAVLICIDGERILWPKCMIPFVYVGDKQYVAELRTNMLYRDDYWKWKVKDKAINCKFVILKKVQKNADQGRAKNVLLLVDDKYMGIIKRVCIDDYMVNVQNHDKCLLLRNQDVNQQLLNKIMEYAVKDGNRRDTKTKTYDKWRSLHCANWIWNLHNHS